VEFLNNMFVIKYKKIFIGISLVLMLASVIALFVYGLNLGIDFRGGSILEVEYTESRPEIDLLKGKLTDGGFDSVVQLAGDKGVLLRTDELGNEEKNEVIGILSGEGELIEKRFSSVGPSLGEELMRKGGIAIVLVIILIILFVTFVFRGSSTEVSSWKYGGFAVFALVHDVLLPTGLVSVMGWEVGGLFLTAILMILGLSVNDTIVVFDRVRENLQKKKKGEEFDEIVGKSLRQTIARSVNTSLTAIVVLLAVYFLGGESTREFSLILAIGMFVGTYSSIFLAAPLLTLLRSK